MRYHLIPSLGLSGLALCVGLLASCSSKNDTPQPTPQPKPGPQPAAKNYVLAVNASASGNQSTTLLLNLLIRTLAPQQGQPTSSTLASAELNDEDYRSYYSDYGAHASYLEALDAVYSEEASDQALEE